MRPDSEGQRGAWTARDKVPAGPKTQPALEPRGGTGWPPTPLGNDSVAFCSFTPKTVSPESGDKLTHPGQRKGENEA